MIKHTLYLSILLLFNIVSAQDRDVVISNNKIGNDYHIYATNHANTTQAVTLFVNTTGYKKHPSEIKKTVAPKDSILMIRLRPIPGKKIFL